MFINILLAILVLSIVVIVHEFGHFIVAKANGVTVLEFSLGFGPRLIHFKKGETIYSIKLLPFGGACLMLGEDFMEADATDDDEDESPVIEIQKNGAADNKDNTVEAGTDVSSLMRNKANDKALENGYDMSKSFANKSVWARIAIIAAGPLFNFLLAFVLAIVIIGSIGYDPCTVDLVNDNSPASEAGLLVGDKITKINGETINFQREYSFLRYYHGDETMNITYERDGKKYTTTVVPQYTKSENYRMGITINSSCGVDTITDDSPADLGGLKKDDVIKSINGVSMNNGTEISDAIAAGNGEAVNLVVSRNGQELSLSIMPELVETESYYTGFSSYGQRVKTTPVDTIRLSFNEVGYWIKSVVKSLGMMFTGQVGVNDLAGPVGTVSMMSNIVEESKADGSFYVFLNLLNFGVMISANLGVMNLLPIPAIDGGRLVFLVIEAVRGKPVKKEREGMVHFVGMILLMLLMIYVMFKDIRGLF